MPRPESPPAAVAPEITPEIAPEIAPEIVIDVLYALPDEQHQVTVGLASGASVADAVAHSGLVERFPAIGEGPLHCAVFNRVVPLQEVLASGDRVEILRPLQVDPKEQRRREAARARKARSKP